MLRFLLDEHLSPEICRIVQGQHPDIEMHSILTWRGGYLRAHNDEQVLAAAADAGLVLVTYDLRTIPPLLHQLAARSQNHAGVVFIDSRSCRPQDLTCIAAALVRLWHSAHDYDWTNRISFATAKADA